MRRYELQCRGAHDHFGNPIPFGITEGVIYQDGIEVDRTKPYFWPAETGAFFEMQNACEREAARLAGVRPPRR